MPYAIRAFVWDDDLETMTAADVGTTVHEIDRTPEFTGLVDLHGTPIYRYEERQPIGFRLGSVKG